MTDWLWRASALTKCEHATIFISDQAAGILALVLLFFFLVSVLRK